MKIEQETQNAPTQALTPQDEAAIQALFAQYGEAWARGDAAACAALYTEDGDALGIDGEMLSGPDAIRGYYERHLSGKYKDLTMSDFEFSRARAIGIDAALMNASWKLNGYTEPAGPVQVRGTFIVRKQAQHWRFAAVRMMVPFVGTV